MTQNAEIGEEGYCLLRRDVADISWDQVISDPEFEPLGSDVAGGTLNLTDQMDGFNKNV